MTLIIREKKITTGFQCCHRCYYSKFQEASTDCCPDSVQSHRPFLPPSCPQLWIWCIQTQPTLGTTAWCHTDKDMRKQPPQPFRRVYILVKRNKDEAEFPSDLREMQTASRRSHKSLLPSKDSPGYHIYHVGTLLTEEIYNACQDEVFTKPANKSCMVQQWNQQLPQCPAPGSLDLADVIPPDPLWVR